MTNAVERNDICLHFPKSQGLVHGILNTFRNDDSKKIVSLHSKELILTSNRERSWGYRPEWIG